MSADGSVLAEALAPGVAVEWLAPPSVRAPVGMLPFAAPSARGTVYGHEGGAALVRFQYKNPTGGMSWSAPIAVLVGQPCTVVIT